MDLSRRIDALLPLVSKPTRYLGNELNVVRKEAGPGTARWCLILPEVYEIGMSHLGLRVLYHVLNSHPHALAERAYAPWFDMEARMRREGVPLFSLESRRPVSQFDFVGFSLQYELTYTNLLNCLDLAGIPLRAEDRRDHDPLIVAGGPCASNPEPLSDFIDLFLIGDGEEAVSAMNEAYLGLRGRPRAEILRGMARLPGIYAPLLYRARYDEDGRFQSLDPQLPEVPARIQRQFVKELESAPWPEDPLVPLQEIVQNRLSLEVLRGCTQGCRFCQAGYIYRPVRERSPERILKMADEGIRRSGWDELGLVSLSTADYTQLGPLTEILNERFVPDTVALSLPSLRADSFGVEVADSIRETRRTGFTFAPEAGSQGLRLAMNKIIRDEEFFAAAHAAYSRGWRLIKMYFMIGLPTETWEDVEKIAEFVDEVRRIGRGYGPSCAVHASVGSFVPKSHTPFQWDRFEDLDVLNEKLQMLRGKVSTRWSRLKWHPVRTSHLEAILSLGDRRLGRVIESAFRQGARFDGWTEHFRYDLWMRALEESGVDPDWYLLGRATDAPLPWDHVDAGVLKKWLIRERRKTEERDFASGKSLTADCRHGDCTACGIPGLPEDTRLSSALGTEEIRRLKERAASWAPAPPAEGIRWPVRLRYEKRGRARFLSHLETTHIFARAFRMARVPLAFSQGHHPHPRLAFGPPLSVGMEGLAEGVDAELLRPWSEVSSEELNRVLPEGLRVLGGTPLPAEPGTRRMSLNAAATRALYHLVVDDLPEAAREACARAVDAFATLASCVVPRSFWTPDGSPEVSDWETPGQAGLRESPGEEAVKPEGPAGESGTRDRTAAGSMGDAVTPRAPTRRRARPTPEGGEGTVRRTDLKKAIVRMRVTGEAAGDATDLRPRGAFIELDLCLAHPEGHTANPRVILEQLFRLSPEDQARVRILRLALLDQEGRPLLA